MFKKQVDGKNVMNKYAARIPQKLAIDAETSKTANW